MKTIAQYSAFRFEVSLEFKVQDCWIGVYWAVRKAGVDVWICLLPMLPIHVRWYR